jgi:DNA-binding NtrC family response regulator
MQTAPILVVDDEPDMRLALSHALNRKGYDVDVAASGTEALTKFNRKDFGMVITDYKMPEMSGLELISQVKAISPEVPVLMITAYGTINNAVEAMREGACDYILKPFSTDALNNAVRKLYGSGGRSGVADEKASSDSKRRQPRFHQTTVITQNTAFMAILNLARTVAPSDANILLQGETGTGKEVVASFIHQNSRRGGSPYVAVNCAALPDTLAESELFGHEKGAFTGAANRKKGKFELAQGGTLVLDEISEMPLPLQAKLLRVIQEKQVDRVGGERPVAIDARIIAISNVDLKKAVYAGKFREDLYYRINVIPITIPPLRDRKEDIRLLSEYFIEKYGPRSGKRVTAIDSTAVALLEKQPWKGNVRELENTIERATLLASGSTITEDSLLLDSLSGDGGDPSAVRVGWSVKEMEKELIIKTLEEVNDNRTRAAEILGISIRTLRNKLNEYKASRQQEAADEAS